MRSGLGLGTARGWGREASRVGPRIRGQVVAGCHAPTYSLEPASISPRQPSSHPTPAQLQSCTPSLSPLSPPFCSPRAPLPASPALSYYAHPRRPRPPSNPPGSLPDGSECAKLWTQLLRTAGADLNVNGELPPLPAFPGQVRVQWPPRGPGSPAGPGREGGRGPTTSSCRSPAAALSARRRKDSPWEPRPSSGRLSRRPRRGEAGTRAAPTLCSARSGGARGPPQNTQRPSSAEPPALRSSRRRSSPPSDSRPWTRRQPCRAVPCAKSTSPPGEWPPGPPSPPLPPRGGPCPVWKPQAVSEG